MYSAFWALKRICISLEQNMFCLGRCMKCFISITKSLTYEIALFFFFKSNNAPLPYHTMLNQTAWKCREAHLIFLWVGRERRIVEE